MSLILGLGSNLDNRIEHINAALSLLQDNFSLIKHSGFYKSDAVDYINQPFFINSVAEFETPSCSPMDIINICQDIESQLGRVRVINKGPRTIDIDVLFIDLNDIESKKLTVPHPRLFSRSFVVKPLKELPYYTKLEKHFSFPKEFDTQAHLFI